MLVSTYHDIGASESETGGLDQYHPCNGAVKRVPGGIVGTGGLASEGAHVI